MIEIALCLAIIGFALVGIIGVLPIGMGVQKENREETIIDQDATVWMDAIRSGARGYDDLTNYVVAITNVVQQWNGTNKVGNPDIYVFTTATHTTPATYTLNGTTLIAPAAGGFYLMNGFNIIGLLSKPKLEPPVPPPGTAFSSNYIVANIRAISGAAVEKFPQQTNETILADAFSYRLITEIVPYVAYDTNAVNYTGTTNIAEQIARLNYSRVMTNLLANSRDLRLTFRWPLLPNGDAGNGRQTFRALTGGQPFVVTNNNPPLLLYFFQPSLYATNSP